jgi:hypothetical protein
MARFDGAKNGLGVVLWTIAVGIILGSAGAVLATRVNLISPLHLPDTMPMVTISGVIGLAIALLVMLLASMLGGRRGVDYHRKIDRYVQPQGQQPAA